VIVNHTGEPPNATLKNIVHDNNEVIIILVVVNNPAPLEPKYLPNSPALVALINGNIIIVKYIYLY